MVGSGAKVLGPFKVGDNARIAANSVVLRRGARRIPRSSACPAASSGVNGEKLDHIHTPDPVRLELDALRCAYRKTGIRGKINRRIKMYLYNSAEP